jgi:hypothetical protein
MRCLHLAPPRFVLRWTERPIFQVLPNPYDEWYRSLYDIVEAGARVRYRVNVPEVIFDL